MADIGQALRRRRLIRATVGAAAAAAVVLAIGIVGHEWQTAASAQSKSAAGRGSHGSHMHMHMPGMHASTIRLGTDSPAGDIQMPAPNMQMAAGMRMASPTMCDATPTAAQQRAAVRLVNSSWQGASRFRSLGAAVAAGYRPITPSGDPVVHYLNTRYYLATMLGGPVLNSTEPQSLVYANTSRGAVLVAAMYITTRGGPTPQPGGCLTQWHVHTNLCLTAGLGVVGALSPSNPTCPPGSYNRVTPPMIHVWFVPIPGGPTAIDASDAQIVRAAQRVASPPNGPA